MKKFILPNLVMVFHIFLLSGPNSFAQQKDTLSNPALMIMQKLEDLTESNGDAEIDDDFFIQQMQHFIHDPINLNTATENDLSQLQLLTPLNIHSLLSYRSLLGRFIDIYELQAIPGWSVKLIERLRPYITVGSDLSTNYSYGDQFKKGQRSVIIRATRVLEKSKGYIPDTSKTNYYMGSPMKLFVRFKYMFKNVLQYGITAEKDAGEQFFKGSQKQGFDYYSAHLFARNIGLIKAIAIGDFAVNLGQGLIQWQSGLAARKGSDVLNIKRQEDVLRPYNSSGEINFQRGIGATIKIKLFQATTFINYHKIDGNLVTDSIKKRIYISSLQTSGYHRTKSELNDKHSLQQFSVGGNVSYTNNNIHLGINGIHYSFGWPIIKQPALYNKYSFSGNKWSNYSVDYSVTWQNIHLFGEVAVDANFNKAFISGLLISMDTHVDMSFVYRSFSPRYQSLYSNTFSENSVPNNERGLFAGIRLSPIDVIRIDAYMDLYRFPWLKYRTDATSRGNDYLVQLTFTPNKQVELYTRYHVERKALNFNPDALALNPVVLHCRQGWRTEFSYKLNNSLAMRSRVEMTWYDKKKSDAENGFLLYADVSYKPHHLHFSGTTGFQYFETDSYNTRFYTFHHDVSGSFSTPVSYGKGFSYYVNLNFHFSKHMEFAFRMAQSTYPGKTSIGSGLDEIPGNKKSEIKLQGLINW